VKATTSIDAANAKRWDGSTPGRYEVWYLTFDHAPSNTSYWLRYTLEAPLPGHGDPYACVWFARFDARRPERNFGIHRRFPIGQLTATAEPFALAMAGNKLTSGSAKGELAGAGHAVAWDLGWEPSAKILWQLPDVMYGNGGRGDTTVLAPNPIVAVTGTVTIDGEKLVFASEPLGQSHIWGKKHAHAWAWGRCTFRDRPGAVVEALAVVLRRRGVTLPRLTIATVWLGDEELQFNQYRHTLVNRATWDTGHFSFRAANTRTRITCELAARADDLIVAPYEDPDGEASYCANTEAGTGRLTIWRRRGLGWSEPEVLTGRAHFEVAGRVRDAAVTKDHVLVE
jgi:hypothetical protein